MRRLSAALPVVVLVSVTLGAAPHLLSRQATSGVAIPFELATRHIIVPVTINNSRPLSFVLDTGADAAIVRMETAKELGLKLEGTVNTGGAGAGVQTGQFVRDAAWRLVGLRDFSEPVSLALPLNELPAGMGRAIDGIIGGRFIRRFVMEVDYQALRLVLHEPGRFRYDGTGQTLPLDFDANNHPVLTATITPPGGQPIERRFVFDIGSSGSIILHSPFVREQDLLASQPVTVPVIGAAGAGGKTTGRIGRLASFQVGPFTIDNPIAMFSQDRAGAFANPNLAGNIGAQIASRFHFFLDYGRRRIILEPSAIFTRPFDRAFSGLALKTVPPDYRTFRVQELMPASPATEAGIQVGDVVVEIDGMPADGLTLSTLNEMLEKPATYGISVRRGSQILKLTLTPRKII